MNNNLIKIENKELPQDKTKNYKVIYNKEKRTNGGFVDAIFLASIILTAFLWMYIALIVK